MLTAKFRHLNLQEDDWVLDLGCGEGRHVHGLSMLGTVNAIGVDLNEASLEKAEAGLREIGSPDPGAGRTVSFKRADALNLPFEDDTFDAVICSEVLEHIGPYNDVLTEIRRVLKPDGRLCISVPRAWPERLCWRLAPPPDGYAYEPGGHIRIFDPVDLRVSVERAGFRFRRKHHAHALHVPYWWLKCLYWRRTDPPFLVRVYHRFLVWDLLKRPFLTRALEALLNPLMGKSMVLYFDGERTS